MGEERRIERLEFELAEAGTDILDLRKQLAEARAEIATCRAESGTLYMQIAACDALIEQMADALGGAIGMLPAGYKEHGKCKAALRAADGGE